MRGFQPSYRSRTFLSFLLFLSVSKPLFANKYGLPVETNVLIHSNCAALLMKPEIRELGVSLRRFRPHHVERFAEAFPDLFLAAGSAGLNKNQTLKVVHTLLNSREYEHSEVGDLARKLIQSFRTAHEQKLDLSTQIEALKKIVAVRDLHNALNCLPLAIRHGWTIEQIATLYNTLQRTQARCEDRIYAGMPKLLRTMTAYGVDPQVSFRSMKSLFKVQEVEGVVADLPDMIEISVLKFGLSPNAILERVRDTMKSPSTRKRDFPSTEVKKVFRGLEEQHPKPLASTIHPNTTSSTEADFPLVQGNVRHSTLTYQVRRSFDAGMNDLRDLCLARDEHKEGAFVFDPDTETWFSLGGITRVNHAEYRARTEFADYDLSELSSKPKFIHIHPQSLEWWGKLPRDMLVDPELQDALQLLPAILPSRQDIQMFVNSISKASKAMQPEFIIVHSVGRTTVHLGKDLAAINELGKMFVEIRDSVLADPTIDLKKLKGKNTIDVLQFIITRLNIKLKGQISIGLEQANGIPTALNPNVFQGW